MGELVKAHLDHRRLWRDFDFCYPVLSRRSRGLSLGVNLSPGQRCTFDCVYCEVDRRRGPRRLDVDPGQVEREMALLLDLGVSGEIFSIPPFDSARPEQRRLNDIAFSGDGEPTLAPEFPEVVARLAKLRRERGLDDLKLVLITNATRLQAPEVLRGLELLMANGGEIWAKLDAGTEAHYREIDRSGVPFERALDNLRATALRWPITIQTLFLDWRGQGPGDAEVEAYLGRVRDLRAAGGRLQGIQLYTVARPTPEAEAKPLAAEALDLIARRVREALPDCPVDVFYGPDRA